MLPAVSSPPWTAENNDVISCRPVYTAQTAGGGGGGKDPALVRFKDRCSAMSNTSAKRKSTATGSSDDQINPKPALDSLRVALAVIWANCLQIFGHHASDENP